MNGKATGPVSTSERTPMENCPHRYTLEGSTDDARNRIRCRLVEAPGWPAFFIPAPACAACPGDAREGSIVAAIRAHAAYISAAGVLLRQDDNAPRAPLPPPCTDCAEKRAATIETMRTMAGLPPRGPQ